MSVAYQRVLLKISGEALAGEKGVGLDPEILAELGQVFRKVLDMGIQPAVVVGGGNFWRGRSSGAMDRVTADHIGMLATTMNALALSDALEQAGCRTRVLNAIEMRQISEPYIRKRAVRHLEKGRVVIFAGGTGNPYFSTDTAMALRAAEIGADLTLKATNVDGIYDADPKTHPEAKRYTQLTHDEVLQKRLAVMDANAAAICRDNQLKLAVFSMTDPENIVRILSGEDIGTLVV